MSVLSAQAQRLAEDGLSHSEIEAHLIGEGNAPEQVRQVVDSLSSWITQTRRSQASASDLGDSSSHAGSGVFDLGLGALLFFGGVAASLTGNTLFIGAVLVGMFRLARGVVRLAGA
jgi:hypothetical protein